VLTTPLNDKDYRKQFFCPQYQCRACSEKYYPELALSALCTQRGLPLPAPAPAPQQWVGDVNSVAASTGSSDGACNGNVGGDDGSAGGGSTMWVGTNLVKLDRLLGARYGVRFSTAIYS
jgi:hypothetical protein